MPVPRTLVIPATLKSTVEQLRTIIEDFPRRARRLTLDDMYRKSD